MAMWLARQATAASLPVIGRVLGGRDHTTVLHGVRTMDRLIASDPAWRKRAADLSVKWRQSRVGRSNGQRLEAA